MKSLLKSLLPEFIWNIIRKFKNRLFEFFLNIIQKFKKKLFSILIKNMAEKDVLKAVNDYGLNVYPMSDFYSPLPVMSDLKKNIRRWCKPSNLKGIQINNEEMKTLLLNLEKKYSDEYKAASNYNETSKREFGPGSTEMDAKLLYYMIRDIKPNHYIEVGSGLSTYYCSLATKRNEQDGKPCKITCAEPYPYEMLYTIPKIDVIKKEVQDVELSIFEQLSAGDILFIDSTHIVKVDGDVPYLFLEVIPRLKKGVIIHVHDISFPYNVPYPPELYIFNRYKWPWFFTEPMLLQAFLSYNDSYKIIESIPLLRCFDEDFLITNFSDYKPLSEYKLESINELGYPPCSIWIEKIK